MPFATVAFQLENGLTRFELRQLVGNLLLLAPLGVYGPMLWRPMRSVVLVVVAGAAVSATIELGQLAIASAYGFPVRVADVDDVLLNASGALIGYGIWRLLAQRSLESRPDAIRHAPDR